MVTTLVMVNSPMTVRVPIWAGKGHSGTAGSSLYSSRPFA